VSSGNRLIAALLAGLLIGAALAAFGINAAPLLSVLDPVGSLWLNALRMTVLPLVVALLITGVGGTAQSATAGLAARAMACFVALLLAGALLSALLTTVFLRLWPVARQAAEALRAGAAAAPASLPQLPAVKDWLVGLIPANPFEAASSGAILPLVVFALLFGLAVARIEAARRAHLLEFFGAVVDALFVLVRGVLWTAPLGVFALALGVGFHGGLMAAGAIGHYLVLVCGLSIVLTLMLYPVAVFGGRLRLRDFARAVAPAQAVALSTQSSLASLPAMLAGLAQLPGRQGRSAIVLPLAVSLFRMTSPLVNLAIVLFTAHIYGTPVGPGAMLAGILLAVLTSWSVVGLPSQATFFNTTVPMSVAMGVPLELLPLLLAVEVISDLFRTLGNVTADMAVTAILTRGASAREARPVL
jgi:Na+/H+-dicarboxylate symporter